jgi:hypothetical protein
MLRFSKWSFPSRFPTKTLCVFLFSPMLATCPVHLVLLELIILIVAVGRYFKLHIFVYEYVEVYECKNAL